MHLIPRHFLRMILGALCAVSSATPAALAQDGRHRFGTLNGVPYRISVPAQWNGGLVVFTHGLFPGSSEEIPLAGVYDTNFNGLLADGYAVAQSAVRENGFVVREATEDVVDLTEYFADPDRMDDQGRSGFSPPRRTLFLSCSLGTVVAGLLMELRPDLYDGAFFLGHAGAGFPKSLDIVLDFSVAYAMAFGWPEEWGDVGDLNDGLLFGRDVAPVIRAQLTFLDHLKDPMEDLSIEQLHHLLTPDELDLFARWEFVRMLVGNPLNTFYDESLVTVYGSNGIMVQSLLATEIRAEIETRFGGPAAENADRVYLLRNDQLDYLQALGLDAEPMLVALNSAPPILADPDARRELLDIGFTGEIEGPIISLHSVHDWASIVAHESVYRDTLAAAGTDHLLLQVYSDHAVHCAFTPYEIVASIRALEEWIDSGERPAADYLGNINFPLPEYEPPPWPAPEL